ncbi:energy-coupling factor transporter transmembrane component T family protein [Salinactinospora qingdaonensis]|uniref:energy-coupling factor transporter transmembrane component T family protein n=1 Tax=Salinactinospora qingdaonensis TaxID=702744 RepID=UPI0031E87AEB
MNTLGLYAPGDTPLHRLPAGVKLATLAVAVFAVVLLGQIWVALTACCLAVVLYALGGLAVPHLWRTVRPLLPFLLLIAVFQVTTAGWEVALRVCAQLTFAVLLAGLLTLTTRVSAMLALFERLLRPLRLVGGDPERAALVLALTVRAIPMVATAVAASRAAYTARGLRRSPHRMVVPVIVGLIRSAEAMGEAMVARGID